MVLALILESDGVDVGYHSMIVTEPLLGRLRASIDGETDKGGKAS